jgi:hypothetical protein
MDWTIVTQSIIVLISVVIGYALGLAQANKPSNE